MKRIQINLPVEQYEAARRIAARRGISLSELAAEALQCLETQEDQYFERMMSIVGIVEGGDPDASVEHDRILYEPEQAAREDPRPICYSGTNGLWASTY